MFRVLFLVIFCFTSYCRVQSAERFSRFEIRQESAFDETTDIRFLYQCVDQHNEYRRSNGSSLLFAFNREVENYARKRVTKMALNGKLLPADPSSPFAETSAWTPGTTNPVNCRNIVDHWFHDSHLSLPSSPSLRQDGTFTKKSANPLITDFIWNRATELGCAQAIVHEPNQGVITVCNYYSSNFRPDKKFVSQYSKLHLSRDRCTDKLKTSVIMLAMKLLHTELTSDFDHLEQTLKTVDHIVFNDDPSEGLSALTDLNGDEELKSECLKWRQRFSLPDAHDVREKWKNHWAHQGGGLVKLESMIVGKKTRGQEVIFVENDQEQSDLSTLMKNVSGSGQSIRFRSSSADTKRFHTKQVSKGNLRQTSTAETKFSSTLRLPRIN